MALIENSIPEARPSDPPFARRALAAQLAGQAVIWLIILMFLTFVVAVDDIPLIARWFPQLRPSESTINLLGVVFLGLIPPLSWMVGLFQRLFLRRWIFRPGLWMLASVAAFWMLLLAGMRLVNLVNGPIDGFMAALPPHVNELASFWAGVLVRCTVNGAPIGLVCGLLFGAAQSSGLYKGRRLWTLTTGVFWLLFFAAVNPLLVFLYFKIREVPMGW